MKLEIGQGTKDCFRFRGIMARATRAEDLKKIFREEKLTQEEMAKRLREELKQIGKEAGGAPFQVEAAKQLAQMFRLALKELKEEKK